MVGHYFHLVKPCVRDPVLYDGRWSLVKPNTVMWRTNPGKKMQALLQISATFLHKINLISWCCISCVRDWNVFWQLLCLCVALLLVFNLFMGAWRRAVGTRLYSDWHKFRNYEFVVHGMNEYKYRCVNLLKPTVYVMHQQFNLLNPTGYVTHQQFNLLKPTGHVMHQQNNIQQLYVLPTLYLCVLYLSENKQRLLPLTA